MTIPDPAGSLHAPAGLMPLIKLSVVYGVLIKKPRDLRLVRDRRQGMMSRTSSTCKGIYVYLFLAFFWLVVGVVAQIFWADLERRAIVRIDRSIGGIIFFVLISYNIIRWRMARVRQKAGYEYTDAPPRRRADQPIDSTFDFSDTEPQDEKKKDPPVA